MYLQSKFVLGIVFTCWFVLANPDPQGNCGSCMGTGTRTGSRPYTRPVSRPAPRPTNRPGAHPVTRPGTHAAPRPGAHPAPRPATRPGTPPVPRPITRPATYPVIHVHPGHIPGVHPVIQPPGITGSQPAGPIIQRSEVDGEGPLVDVTQWIEGFHLENQRTARPYPSNGRRRGRPLVTEHTMVQQIAHEQLGNTPFQFYWRISVEFPGAFMIRLSPLSMNTLVEQWSLLHNHVTVTSYVLTWRLAHWERNHPPVTIAAIPFRRQDEPRGPQTVYYYRATEHAPQAQHVPEGACFYRSEFARDGQNTLFGRVYWNLVVEYIE